MLAHQAKGNVSDNEFYTQDDTGTNEDGITEDNDNVSERHRYSELMVLKEIVLALQSSVNELRQEVSQHIDFSKELKMKSV